MAGVFINGFTPQMIKDLCDKAQAYRTEEPKSSEYYPWDKDLALEEAAEQEEPDYGSI